MVQVKSRIIVGNPGCGKTYFMKKKIASALSGNIDSVAYILGSSKEYSDVVSAYDGLVVKLNDSMVDTALNSSKNKLILFDAREGDFSSPNNLASLFKKLNKKAEENEVSHLRTFVFIDGVCGSIDKDSAASDALEQLTFSKNNTTTIAAQEITDGLEMISTESDEAILFPAGAASAYIERLSKQFGFSVKKAKELTVLAEQSNHNGNLISLKRTGQDAEFVPHLYSFDGATSA